MKFNLISSVCKIMRHSHDWRDDLDIENNSPMRLSDRAEQLTGKVKHGAFLTRSIGDNNNPVLEKPFENLHTSLLAADHIVVAEFLQIESLFSPKEELRNRDIEARLDSARRLEVFGVTKARYTVHFTLEL
jgi:hypothetical protein